MPIINIRCTENIGTKAQLNNFIKEIHQQVAPLVDTQAVKFKTSVTFVNHYVAGVEEMDSCAYISITVKALPKPPEKKQDAINFIFQLAEQYFRRNGENCQIVVEFLDLGHYKLG